jgi:hypothetical protein
MSRAAWLNVLLAAAVAALGAWAYFKPAQDAPVEHPLSRLKPAEVRSIRIERPGATPIALEKKQESWFLIAPFSARGDELRVQRLLEVLGATAAHKLSATALERFELAPPQARVAIDKQDFGFGMVSPVTREQYVLTDGAVFAVHPRYGTALPALPAEMASPRLLAPAEKPVRIESKAFTVEQRDAKWALSPATTGTSQDDLARWVEFWQLASAARVEPYARGKPLETIRIQLKEGATLTLGVLQREPELVLLRPDEQLVYYFRADAARRLLSPPAAAIAPAARKQPVTRD